MEMTLHNIEQLLKTAPSHRPYAEFDQDMDCVRVRLRDCSVTEERISEHFTILYDNHCEDGQLPLAGFNIKGVHSLGLPVPVSHKVADYLNMVVSRIPAEEVQELKDKQVINNPVIVNTEICVEPMLA